MPHYKRPNTLREISNKAKAHRAEYNQIYKKHESEQVLRDLHRGIDSKSAWLKDHDQPDDGSHFLYADHRRHLGTMATHLEAVKSHSYSNAQAEVAGKHYHQNEAAYHDLALIDALIDGVVITTDHPLRIGQPSHPSTKE